MPQSGPCTCAALRRLTRQVTAIYDRTLAPTGLKTSQYSLLMHLAGDGVTLSTLAHRTGTDRTTLTRNLATLERSGWIVTGHAEDRRQRLVRLTATGAQARAGAMPYWQQAQHLIETTLTHPAVRDLHDRIDTALRLLRPLTQAN